MGVAGSGKSIIGNLLSKDTDYQFIEGDNLHPKKNIDKMQKGIPLTDEDRHSWLYNIHETLIRKEKIIISCSALKKKYRDFLIEFNDNKKIIIIYLNCRKDILEKRIKNRKAHFFPISLLDSQLRDLEEPDFNEDHITIDTDNNLQQIISNIKDIIKLRYNLILI